MIIWLASYPKSGNTWLRILIGQLISDNNDKNNFYQNSKKILNYPEIKFFKELVKDHTDRAEIVKNWVNSQNILCLKSETQILKTHNMLGSFGKYAFTNSDLTSGVIHVVRDPRNVVSSVKNHFSFKDINEAKEFMFKKDAWIHGENRVDTFISSWGYNYISWKSFKKNYLLIKYEDLIENTRREVIKVSNYLKQFFEIKVKESEIDQIIENASFENLQKIESKGEFDENTKNKNTGKKNKFFRLGASNDWKSSLNKNVVDEIEKEFSNEMKELGYL